MRQVNIDLLPHDVKIVNFCWCRVAAGVNDYSELRRMADLVRSFVHARKSASVAEISEWARQFLKREPNAGLDARLDATINLLCMTGDVGFGSIRNERVLLALAERIVQLPDGRSIALGDHGMPMEADRDALFPDASARPTHTLLEYLQEIDETPPPRISRLLPPLGKWSEPTAIPRELSRALALCGKFDPVTLEWSMSQANADFLNEWFGALYDPEPQGNPDGPDEKQEEAIGSPASAKVMIEAGPGSGKTFVACTRVASLVERNEAIPSRILVLSFTRVAVGELRDRISASSYGSGRTASVHIRTFDAFASRLLSIAGVPTKGGHDASIRAATRILQSGDPLVLDVVDRFEHVFIDEAQDLVGDRKAFCEALVDVLHPSCGVTVLGDPAQAIYGYQADKADKASFIEVIRDRPDFAIIRLDRDHRTRSAPLREMFAGCRERLLVPEPDPKARYFDIRERIQAAAVESGITSFSGHPSTTRGLILTRTRRSLITVAETLRSQGRAFRMRVPDRPLHVEAWIGATLGGLPGNQRISRDGFLALFEDLTPSCERDALECWQIFQDLDGSIGEHVVVSNIAEALEDPPLEIVREHEGSAGPLLSTIHAIKGLESDRVLLLLTRAPSAEDVDWDEEARALYVGATRASAELRTAWISPSKYYRTGQPERHWAPRADYRMLEIGLDGDLLTWGELSKEGLLENPRATIAGIWSAAGASAPIRAVRDRDGNYLLFAKDEEPPALGCLSEVFMEAVGTITQATTDDSGPETVDGIIVSGATTVVSSGLTGNLPPIGLMPLLSGFCRIDR